MTQRRSGRGGFLVAGIGLGIAAGVAVGTLVIAPHVPGGADTATDGAAAGAEQTQSPQEDGQEQEQQEWSDPDDDAVAALGPALVAGSLTERPTIVMHTADSDTAAADKLAELTEQAGAIPAGRIELTEKFFDPAAADELRTLAAHSLPAGAQLSTDAEGAGTHAGELLAAALLLDPDDAQPQASTDDRELVLTSLREAGFIDYDDDTILPAQGILLSTGDSTDDTAARDFAEALHAGGAATVVAGPRASAEDGVIRALREGESEVSTIDSAEQSWARVSAVLALVEQIAGDSGHYGLADNAQGTVPAPRAENEE